MGYEARIAGLQDHAPGQQLKSLAVRALELPQRPRAPGPPRRRRPRPPRARPPAPLRQRRRHRQPRVHRRRQVRSQLAAGSGLYGPLLFDGYATFAPLPAAGFALPVVRRPAPGIYTCFGGGSIASGAAGPDRLPRPYLQRAPA